MLQPINLQILTLYAKKNNHYHLTAKDGAEAVAAYRIACKAPGTATSTTAAPAKPRVILMDVNMPIMNGFEATRQIRAYEQENKIEPATIIALTGLGSTEAQHEAFSSGMNLFLTKPVRLKELTRILEGVTGGE